MEKLLGVPIQALQDLPTVWTFMLLVIRYGALMTAIPGVGMGQRGSRIRMPGILVMAGVSLISGQRSPVPVDWAIFLGSAASEFIFGLLLGFIPALAVAGVQFGAQLSSTTMGLGAAQLLDPNLGINVPSLGRIFGDISVILFLGLGGHHLVIYAASGLGGQIVPGTYLMSESTVSLLIERTAMIFQSGVMMSAPVVVALLLTQFVMGLISKAVPTVNIFIVSFPLTIGIGLVLSVLSLPEIMVYMDRQFSTLEPAIQQISEETQLMRQNLDETVKSSR